MAVVRDLISVPLGVNAKWFYMCIWVVCFVI